MLQSLETFRGEFGCNFPPSHTLQYNRICTNSTIPAFLEHEPNKFPILSDHFDIRHFQTSLLKYVLAINKIQNRILIHTSLEQFKLNFLEPVTLEQ